MLDVDGGQLLLDGGAAGVAQDEFYGLSVVGEVEDAEHIAGLAGDDGVFLRGRGCAVSAGFTHGAVGDVETRGVVPAEGLVGVLALVGIDAPPGVDGNGAVGLNGARDGGGAVWRAGAGAVGHGYGSDAVDVGDLLARDGDGAGGLVDVGADREAVFPEVGDDVYAGSVGGGDGGGAQSAVGSQGGGEGLEGHDAPPGL